MVLSHLTVIDPTENPDPEQASLADLWLDGARGYLVERGLCWWDEDDIPASVLVPLVRYCAGSCAMAFGRGGKGYEADAKIARGEIAALKSGEQREVVPTDYS